ncbi:MAG: methyltransferase domain-containing protein [Pyrinomonadaceae bacterium]
MHTLQLKQRLDFIKSLCVGKKVLHLGCTNYPYTRDSIREGMLLHSTLAERAGQLYGFDADEDGLNMLRELGFGGLYRADLEKLDELELEEKFDVIIAGEMIEHLNNPGLFLEGIGRFMNSDSELVITTVNAYCAMRFFQYGVSRSKGRNEPVHPDHVAYYSYSTLCGLVERHGLTVSDFYFYDLGLEHRPFASRLQRIVNDISVRLSPQLADGLIAICRLNAPHKGL